MIQFKDWDRDIQITASEARDRIDAIRADLPDDLQRYFVNNFSPSDQPIIRMRFSSNRDLRKEYDLIEREVKKRIERLPAWRAWSCPARSPNEVEISIDPARLGAHNVALNQLAAKLQAINSRSPPARSTRGSADCACSRWARSSTWTSCATWCSTSRA
jgi:HAE1 family hydrophobic/amphiphilic exporter-1